MKIYHEFLRIAEVTVVVAKKILGLMLLFPLCGRLHVRAPYPTIKGALGFLNGGGLLMICTKHLGGKRGEKIRDRTLSVTMAAGRPY